MKDVLAIAEETLASAEDRLRALIRAALENQRYSDVAKLAPLADAVLQVMKTARSGYAGLSSVHAAAAQGGGNDKHALPQFTAEPTIPLGPDLAYPRFERHGDKLVKVAWSKKDRREYEHRASADVIFRIAELFQRDRGLGTPFNMDS